jgi:hypothetical protein
MRDLDHLIESTAKAMQTLTLISMNEREYGFEICQHLEGVALEMYRNLRKLEAIKGLMVGGVA